MKKISAVRVALGVVSMAVLALSCAPPVMAKRGYKERSQGQDYRQSGGNANGCGGGQAQYYQGRNGQWNNNGGRGAYFGDNGGRGAYSHDNGLHKGWYKGKKRGRHQHGRNFQYNSGRNWNNNGDRNSNNGNRGGDRDRD